MQPPRPHIKRCPERGQLCPRDSKLRDSRTWLSALRRMRARFWPWFAWCLATGLAGTALTLSAQPEVYGNPDSIAFIRIPRDADDWTRHFHIGALVGMNISASFSMNGNFGVNRPPGVYDDGYVHPTGDPLGYTTDWGYNWGPNNATAAHPSQYDPVAQTLTMHATTSFSASGSANADGGPFPGFEMAYGDNLWYWKHARVGWEFGFGWLPINISDNQTLSGNVKQSVYIFNVANSPLNLPLPQAPYQGGPNGGHPIPDSYSSSSSNNLAGTVSGSHTLDANLFTFRLGPSFYWDLTDHFGFSLGAGPAVGLVDGSYKFDEIITAGSSSAHNTGQIRGTKLVYGGYVNGTLYYHVQNNADIFVGAQYMPMSDATISGGGREGRLNLGGQLYFTVGVSWPF